MWVNHWDSSAPKKKKKKKNRRSDGSVKKIWEWVTIWCSVQEGHEWHFIVQQCISSKAVMLQWAQGLCNKRRVSTRECWWPDAVCWEMSGEAEKVQIQRKAIVQSCTMETNPHDSTGFLRPLWHQPFHAVLVWLSTNLRWQSQSRNPTLWMKNSKLIIQIYCDICVGVQLFFFFFWNWGDEQFCIHKTLHLFYLFLAHDNLSPNLIGKHNPFRERNEIIWNGVA